MSTTTSPRVVPVFCLVLGLAMFLALALNGHVARGAAAGGIMVAYGAVLALGGRSQYLRMLRGQHDDERLASVELRATSVMGNVLALVIVVGFLQALARDVGPEPYPALGAVAGVTYLTALAWFRWRG